MFAFNCDARTSVGMESYFVSRSDDAQDQLESRANCLASPDACPDPAAVDTAIFEAEGKRNERCDAECGAQGIVHVQEFISALRLKRRTHLSRFDMAPFSTPSVCLKILETPGPLRSRSPFLVLIDLGEQRRLTYAVQKF